MFILKETENSDVRCGSVITNFETMDEAQQRMRELYQKTVNILGGNFDAEEDEECCPENQRWATISATSAHIQNCMDAYDWEIIEDPEWVKKKNYRDEDTGISDKNSRKLLLGDKVALLDKFHGTVIFESGAYGIGFMPRTPLTGITSKAKSSLSPVATISLHFAKTTTSYLCGSFCGTSTVKTMCASYSKKLGRCEIC